MKKKKTFSKIAKLAFTLLFILLTAVAFPFFLALLPSYHAKPTISEKWVSDGIYDIRIGNHSLFNLYLSQVWWNIIYVVKIRNKKTGQEHFCPVQGTEFGNSLNPLGTLWPFQIFTRQIAYAGEYSVLFNKNLQDVYDSKPFAVINISYTDIKNETLTESKIFEIYSLSTSSPYSFLEPVIISDQATADNVETFKSIKMFPSGEDFCPCMNYSIKNKVSRQHYLNPKSGCKNY